MARPKKEANDGLQQENGQEAAKEVKHVQMEREGKTATVHPLEVQNMKSHGWVEVK